ncbi:MAG: DUF4349 domain-containing protein [Clostridia bacterium]|nr:DUF4349 domain-containing protein [Clostridia bacterium]
MKRSVLILAAFLLSALLLLSGCAKSYNGAQDYYAPREAEYNRSDSVDGIPASTYAPSPSDASANDPLINRKIIRNASLGIETLDFDSFVKAINDKVAELGGYVQSNVVRNRSSYYDYRNGGTKKYLRSAEIVYRIPADRLDEFLAAADGLGNIISRNETVSDVTESYVDVEARLRSLRTEYDTLLGLLSRAENLEEIIMLQDRLTNVRYEIESYEARLRSYDSQIAFSTVSIDLSEVERETAVAEETFGEETARRFRESLEDVGEGFRDFAAWFLGNLPRILVFLFFVVCIPLVIVLIIVGSVKRKRRKKKALAEAKAAEAKAVEENK